MFIKRLLYSLFGIKTYLKIISSIFFISYFNGFLRRKKSIALHYFSPTLLQKGNSVIDIGANLGYYTIPFSKKVGSSGRVYAVEPVTLFRDVLNRNIRKHARYNNIKVLPFALGDEDNKRIAMGVPADSKYFRHGLTKVLNEEERNTTSGHPSFMETMMTPESLFADLTQLHFIKCDVEGYEMHIFPHLVFLLKKFHPMIQIETDGQNRIAIIDLLKELNYTPYYYLNKKLHPYTGNEKFHTGDLLFFTPDHQKQLALVHHEN